MGLATANTHTGDASNFKFSAQECCAAVLPKVAEVAQSAWELEAYV